MRGLERHLFSVHQRGYFAILLTAQVTCHINKAGGIRVIFLRHETRVVFPLRANQLAMPQPPEVRSAPLRHATSA
jgi:hypothetical protein